MRINCPYLVDENKSTNTKQVVIDIARACSVQQLAPDFAGIAVDFSQESALRIPAGAAAAEIGSLNVKVRLRPFALGSAGDDPDDELKGIGLTALWPELMNSVELFSLLSRPQNRHLHGAYGSFLYDLRSKLRVEDLPAALEWFARQPQRDMGAIDSLMDSIIELAWLNIEESGISAAFGKAIISRIKIHDQLISDHDKGELTKNLCADHKRRQLLLRELIPQLVGDDFYFLDYAGVKMIPEIDLPWLIDRIESKECGTSEKTEIEFVRRIIDTRDPNQMRRLWFACQANTVLNEVCKDRFMIELDSESARINRENLKYLEKKEKKLLDPSPNACVLQDLSNIEQGNLLGWVQLATDLSLEPTSTHWHSVQDLTVLPGWKLADGKTRERIIAAALQYANQGDPQNEKWFGTMETYYSAIGGLQVLTLLLGESPAKLNEVSNYAWEKWVPILVSYHNAEAPEKSFVCSYCGWLMPTSQER